MAHIQIRWILAALGMYACALLFASRTAMSVAIVSMTRVHSTENQQQQKISEAYSAFSSGPATAQHYHCATNTSTLATRLLTAQLFQHKPVDATAEAVAEKPEFEWNETLQGVVLGSSFYLYFIVPTFAGRLTDAVGAKWITFAGIIVPCLLTALIPPAIRTVGVGAAIAIQTTIGAFHGTIYPSLFSLNTKWFPQRERMTANSLIIFGGSVGNGAMYLIGGFLCETTIGWPLVFYLLAALHVPWVLAWLYFASSEPSANKRVSDGELMYLKENVVQKAASRHLKAPWFSILTSTAVWSSICAKMAAGFGYFMLVSKVPTFLSGVYGVPIAQNGTFSALATCSPGISSLIAPFAANFCINRLRIRSIVVRKLFQSVSLLGPAVCLATITLLECNFTAAITLIFIGLLCYGLLTGGEFSIIPSFAPNFAGTVVGFALLLPFSMGIAAPYLVGAILDSSSTGDTLNDKWNLIFYITAAFYVFGCTIFIIFATDQQQHWDKVPLPDDGSSGQSAAEDGFASTESNGKHSKFTNDSSAPTKSC